MNAAGCQLLARVVDIVKSTPASEASSERGFFLVSSSQRFSLSGHTVATQVKYASLLAGQEKDAIDLFPSTDEESEEINVPKFTRKGRKIQRIEPQVHDDDDDEEVAVAADEATLVARTVQAILDMAVEKAVEVQRSRDKRRNGGTKKTRCEGPVAFAGPCEKYNINASNYQLLLCTIYRKTRCTSCGGFRFGSTFTGQYVCNQCKDDDVDD